MIDYLERLFDVVLPTTSAQTEEWDSLLPAEARPAVPEAKGLPDVEARFWQQEVQTRLNSALDIDAGARESIALSRPVRREAGEELEHRLRRDSRRYDSGFFLY